MIDNNQYYPILEIKNLSVNFGGINALNDFDLDVYPGEIRAIIGPNGAGKTTLFNVLSLFYKPSQGKIYFAGKNIRELKPHQIISLGLCRTFQKSELFESMTVFENISMGLHIRRQSGLLESAIKTKKSQEEERICQNHVTEILQMLKLTDYTNTQVDSIPFGIRRIVEIGRAIISHPKLLLLDEPAAGMNYTEKARLSDTILDFKQKMNVTLILVEHDMQFVMNIADMVTVLNYGKKIAEGKPEEIKNNPKVIEAYLGKEN